MNTIVLPVSISFTSLGESTALVFDLTTAPVSLDLRGVPAVGIQKPVLTGAAGAPIAGVAATLLGSVVTVALPSILPTLDGNGNLIVYVLTCLVQLANAA